MKKIFRSLLFFVILFALVELSVYILIPECEDSKYSFIARASNEVLQEKKGDIDVLVIGDDLAVSSINPLQIWNNYGYTTYVLDQTGLSMEYIYNNLNTSIDYQSPKIVILESHILFNELESSEWYDELNNKFMNLVPIYKYHNNWKYLLRDGKIETSYYKGFDLSFEVNASTNYNYMEVSKNATSILEDNVDWLQNMIRLCERNNISFLLVSTPSQKEFNYSDRIALIRLANYVKTTYMDMNLGNPISIDWEKDTYDEGTHLNYLGSYKVTNHIAEYLYTSKLLTDHRKDEKYASWNDAYKQFEKDIVINIR